MNIFFLKRLELSVLFRDKTLRRVFFVLLMFFVVWVLYLYAQFPSVFEHQKEIYRDHISSNIRAKGYWISRAKLLAKSRGDEFMERFEANYDFQTSKMMTALNQLEKENSYEQKLSDANSINALEYLVAAQFFTNNTDKKPNVYTLYPEKIKAFLATIRYPYIIEDFDDVASDDAKKSDVEYAHLALMAERAIDNYFSDRVEPTNDFNIYYFLMRLMSKSSERGVFQPRLVLLTVCPVLVAYYIFKISNSGYINNIFMLPQKRFHSFLHLFILTYIIALFFYYIPQIVSCTLALLLGKPYNWNTDMVVIRRGYNTFRSLGQTNGIFPTRYIGLSQLLYVPYGAHNTISNLSYSDFMSVRFSEFLLRAATVDFLKVTFIVVLSTSVVLTVMKSKYRIVVVAALSFCIFFFEQKNIQSRLSYFNPFAVANGWNITLGAEQFTWFRAIFLLAISIVGILLLTKLTVYKNYR